MRSQRVVVIGGGIAGLSAAYFLRRAGLEVVVLEAGVLGSGASSGNAGWISPAQAGPLPEPGLARYGLKSLFRRESALYIAPSYLPRMLPWLIGFARRCNQEDHRRGVIALAELGRRSFDLVETLKADGVEFESYRQGMLVVSERRASAEAFLSGLAPLRDFGFAIPRGAIDGAELREREPILSGAVNAGVVIEEHVHVRPMTLVDGLAARLKEMGVTIELETPVTEVISSSSGVLVRTRSGHGHPADAAVVAAGAWSPGLVKPLGCRLPIAAGKGYSFEVPLPRSAAPRSAMLLLDPHVGFSPFGDCLRLAGTMEFSGINTRIDERRVEAISRGAARLFGDIDFDVRENVWTGMRPVAPDGLPVIDVVPGTGNVYIAGGYSMLGMTLAAPAGELLAHMVSTGRRPAELVPFRIGRFRTARWRVRAAVPPGALTPALPARGARARRWRTRL
jgi:D-amino-acid dehydrogenase